MIIAGSKRAGFSLAEQLVVVTIIGLLAVIAAPSFSDALHSRAASAASDQFVMAHGLARSTALRYGRVSELHINAETGKFWIEIDTSGLGERAVVSDARSVYGGGLTMTSNRSLLCFDPHGLSATTGACEDGDALLIFTSADKVDTVRTTALGKVLR
ncbi:MAG: prepilin-type N-terminal cleavage/methylation domain-containing protein [Gemmatimonadota bacterium]|nr:prepilin-type N-terminal cleavage/methylation domain-containing protein [Gemmatimonadota bacterium]